MTRLLALTLSLVTAVVVGAVPIPSTFFSDISFEPLLEDRYETGEAILVAGEVAAADWAEGQLLLQFLPDDGGETVQIFINLTGRTFHHYHIFSHNQAGTYTLNLFAGGAEARQLGYVGTFESVVINQSSGPIELPTDFFPGIRLDGPLPTAFTTSAGVSLAGAVVDEALANGQILFNFVHSDEEFPLYIKLDGQVFRRGSLFVGMPSGSYDLEVYLGGEGATLGYIGQFPVELRDDGIPLTVPPDFFSGVVFDEPLPISWPVQRDLSLSGSVASGISALRFDVVTSVREVDLEVPVTAGRFAATLRLEVSEVGRFKIQLVRETAEGWLHDSGSFEFAAIAPPPAPALSLGALSLGLLPGEEVALPLTNVGFGVLGALRFNVDGPFVLVSAPMQLDAGVEGRVVLRYYGSGGDHGALLIHSDDPQRPLQRVALNGLHSGALPQSFIHRSAGAGGSIDLKLDLDDREYGLVLYAAEVAALGQGLRYPFSLGGTPPAARRAMIVPESSFHLALREREQALADGYRAYRDDPAAKVVAGLQVGAQRVFIFDEEEAGVPRQQVVATLVAASERALGWLQDDLRDHEDNIAVADIAAMIERFSAEDYEPLVSVFGRPSDVDGDGRLSFLYTHLVDELDNIAGFYSAAAVLPVDAGGDGNVADLLFISPTQRLSTYRSLLVHEAQHLINFNEHVIVRRGAAEVSWLNEGLSHVAEDQVADYAQSGNGGNIAKFLSAPEAVSLEAEAIDDARHRGAAYLFVRSLVDRMGPGVLLRLVGTGLADRANVEAATGEGMAELLAAWGAQLYVSGLGLDEHPRFNYQTNLLRAGAGRGFGLPSQREYRIGDVELAGTVPFRGLVFVRVRGVGRQTLEIASDPLGRVGVVAIPLTRDFAERARVPASYVPGVRFDPMLPAELIAGRAYAISGSFLDEGVRAMALSYEGPDSLDFFVETDGANFSAVVEIPKDGAYTLNFFTGPGQGAALDFAADFGPVWVRDRIELTAVLKEERIPGEYRLGQLYPNPFNARVVVPVTVPGAGGRIAVVVYNTLGQAVRVLFDGNAVGRMELQWDGRDGNGHALASGVYFVRARAPGFAAVRKVALLQ